MLGNWKILGESPNWMGRQLSSLFPFKKCVFGNGYWKLRKNSYQNFLQLSDFAFFSTFGLIFLPGLSGETSFSHNLPQSLSNVNNVIHNYEPFFRHLLEIYSRKVLQVSKFCKFSICLLWLKIWLHSEIQIIIKNLNWKEEFFRQSGP